MAAPHPVVSELVVLLPADFASREPSLRECVQALAGHTVTDLLAVVADLRLICTRTSLTEPEHPWLTTYQQAAALLLHLHRIEHENKTEAEKE